MEQNRLRNTLLALTRLGISNVCTTIPDTIDLSAIKILAEKQGLSAIVLDGLEEARRKRDGLRFNSLQEKILLAQWIGEMSQSETIYSMQQQSAREMALLFHHSGIRTYVLKGTVVAECYPKPEHRPSVDMDCYLLPETGDFDAWEKGNRTINSKNYEVKYDYYKNSTFILPDLIVENHQYFTPFRGNKRLTSLEKVLQALIKKDIGENRIGDTWLFRPPVMVSALFLIEHAYSHFLHEGLTWRHVLDWMMYSKKHEKEINWNKLNARIDEFGFRKFYDSYYRLGQYLFGELSDESLDFKDRLMLRDVWEELDLHDTVQGLRGKLALVGNTWRARWKYRYFSDISMIHALWIQVRGFLFMKNPILR